MKNTTLEVIEHLPTRCSTTGCPNDSGGGRMVRVRWKRSKATHCGLMNELSLCSPCWSSLYDEMKEVARAR